MADLTLALRGTPAAAGWDALRDEPGPDTVRCLGLYSKLTAGVTVVTALDGTGRPTGMTVSALTSLSARPPLVLACLRSGSRTLSALREQGSFAVSLLTAHQKSMAERFADSSVPPARRFTGSHVRQVLGLPVLVDALAWSVCLVEDVQPYGDHHAVVGRVMAVEVNGGRPLVWHDRGFHTLNGPRPTSAED
ncbi:MULTISPECIES: flavin reductase family protein [Streptomyces]|uniref:Flavin reductase n=1 Tax=Streptomyces dengpaensis TaxID=2049881 RepID=A0ABN5HVJ8_9ACTN|nr:MULTISPECIES: flavin reductase family protein [Streptomyces]AVH55170.1 flavin reductase [Streptomyces dengpaensis]PIB07458.1 flavin oxidoreductase [Streptomyces sp. HG99]